MAEKESKCVTTTPTPWKNGYWYSYSTRHIVQIVDGNSVKGKMHTVFDFPEAAEIILNITWTFGDFGPAKEVISEVTGMRNYNMELKIKELGIINHGVLSEDGTKIHLWGIKNELEVINWLNKEDLQKVKEDRDPVDSPPCAYFTPTPDKTGKIIWLSGPPGSGKSTTAACLAKNHGMIYYEGDSVLRCLNPFPDPNLEPINSIFKQKPLKGLSEDYIRRHLAASEEFKKMMKGNFDSYADKLQPLYKNMGHDIVKQAKRLGGDMIIAQAVFSRDQRDYLREIVGSKLIFLVFNMNKDCQMKRVTQRTPGIGEKYLKILYNYAERCEPAAIDEINTYNLTITEEMTREDVEKTVLEFVQKV